MILDSPVPVKPFPEAALLSLARFSKTPPGERSVSRYSLHCDPGSGRALTRLLTCCLLFCCLLYSQAQYDAPVSMLSSCSVLLLISRTWFSFPSLVPFFDSLSVIEFSAHVFIFGLWSKLPEWSTACIHAYIVDQMKYLICWFIYIH